MFYIIEVEVEDIEDKFNLVNEIRRLIEWIINSRI